MSCDSICLLVVPGTTCSRGFRICVVSDRGISSVTDICLLSGMGRIGAFMCWQTLGCVQNCSVQMHTKISTSAPTLSHLKLLPQPIKPINDVEQFGPVSLSYFHCPCSAQSTTADRIVALLVTVVGMLIFAVMISMVCDGLEKQFESLRQVLCAVPASMGPCRSPCRRSPSDHLERGLSRERHCSHFHSGRHFGLAATREPLAVNGQIVCSCQVWGGAVVCGFSLFWGVWYVLGCAEGP